MRRRRKSLISLRNQSFFEMSMFSKTYRTKKRLTLGSNEATIYTVDNANTLVRRAN